MTHNNYSINTVNEVKTLVCNCKTRNTATCSQWITESQTHKILN